MDLICGAAPPPPKAIPVSPSSVYSSRRLALPQILPDGEFASPVRRLTGNSYSVVEYPVIFIVLIFEMSIFTYG